MGVQRGMAAAVMRVDEVPGERRSMNLVRTPPRAVPRRAAPKSPPNRPLRAPIPTPPPLAPDRAARVRLSAWHRGTLTLVHGTAATPLLLPPPPPHTLTPSHTPLHPSLQVTAVNDALRTALEEDPKVAPPRRRPTLKVVVKAAAQPPLLSVAGTTVCVCIGCQWTCMLPCTTLCSCDARP